MYCSKCGKPIHDKAVYCPHCGAAVSAQPLQPAQQGSNAVAVVGFVLAVVSAVLGVFSLFTAITIAPELIYGILFSIFLALAGAVCSIVGLVRARKNRRKHKGFALAGIIIPGVFIVMSFLALIILAKLAVLVVETFIWFLMFLVSGGASAA